MSKRMKVLLIVGICLTFLGIGMCNASRVMGFHGSFGITTGLKYVELETVDRSITKTGLQPFTDIDARIEACSVELVPSDGYYIEYEGTPEMEYAVEDGTLLLDGPGVAENNRSWYVLYVGDFRRGFFVGTGHGSGDVILVYYPKGEKLNRVSVTSDLGNIKADGLDCAELELVTAMGSFEINDTVAEEMTIRSDMGDIHINDLKGKSANIEVSMGEIVVEDVRLSQLDMINSYGNIEAEDVHAENITAESSCGDTELNDFSVTGSLNVTADFGDVELSPKDGAENYSLDMETDFGRVRIKGRNYGSTAIVDNDGPELRVRNSNGDIDVR